MRVSLVSHTYRIRKESTSSSIMPTGSAYSVSWLLMSLSILRNVQVAVGDADFLLSLITECSVLALKAEAGGLLRGRG